MAHLALDIDIAKPEESSVYKRGYSRFIHHILISGDLIILNLAFLVANFLATGINPLTSFQAHFASIIMVSNLAWIVNVYVLDIYAISRVKNWEVIIWNVIKAIIVHSFIVSLFVLSISGYFFSRELFLIYYAIFMAAIFSWRTVFVGMIISYRSQGYNFRKVVIVGANEASLKIYKYFNLNKSHGYNLKAVFGDNIDQPKSGKPYMLPENMLYDYLGEHKIDEIYCALPLTSVKKIRSLMSYAENNMIRFRYVPDFRALLYKNVDIEYYGTVPVLSVRSEPLEHIGNRLIKRLFDFSFSLIALIILIPLVFPVVALCIRLTSKGPVFFRQLRSGKENEEFYCYKFRTMSLNKGSDELQATANDPRVTKIGKFLRKTNIDELPQFINVLLGDMSIVGPRPHMIKHTNEYKLTIDKYMIRHLVKPGITGWAQVNGYRGVTETPKKMIKRARYDIWYIENWSLLLDIKIISLTIYNMLKGDKNAC